jgi:hypothetical protein
MDWARGGSQKYSLIGIASRQLRSGAALAEPTGAAPPPQLTRQIFAGAANPAAPLRRVRSGSGALEESWSQSDAVAAPTQATAERTDGPRDTRPAVVDPKNSPHAARDKDGVTTRDASPEAIGPSLLLLEAGAQGDACSGATAPSAPTSAVRVRGVAGQPDTCPHFPLAPPRWPMQRVRP